MFTGIISDIGEIIKIEDKTNSDKKISVRTDKIDLSDLKLGSSISCNGICLTATYIADDKKLFEAELSNETIKVTNAKFWQIGELINLEKSLKIGDEISGHLVSGHVDGMAELTEIKKSADSTVMVFELINLYDITTESKEKNFQKDTAKLIKIASPSARNDIENRHCEEFAEFRGNLLGFDTSNNELAKFIAKKGSITLNGISLTINYVENNSFTVNIIKHTLENTNFYNLRIGSKVNVEIDMLARYTSRLLEFR